MNAINSHILFEYPHSLSYQATNLTKFGLRRILALTSNIQDLAQ